jgi:hypothetical protein
VPFGCIAISREQREALFLANQAQAGWHLHALMETLLIDCNKLILCSIHTFIVAGHIVGSDGFDVPKDVADWLSRGFEHLRQSRSPSLTQRSSTGRHLYQRDEALTVGRTGNLNIENIAVMKCDLNVSLPLERATGFQNFNSVLFQGAEPEGFLSEGGTPQSAEDGGIDNGQV